MEHEVKTIRCARCGERREPYIRHAIFCRPCWQAIEAEMERRAAEPKTSDLFARTQKQLEAEREFRREYPE